MHFWHGSFMIGFDRRLMARIVADRWGGRPVPGRIKDGRFCLDTKDAR